MARWGWLKLEEWEADRIKWQKGDEGETAVGKILATLSDEFHVINDIKVPKQESNLDHVVVGPTRVFVLDAKNNRGLVQADGSGELLVNCEPARNLSIRRFVSRYMAVRDMVRELAPGTDPYLQGLFVFTSAWVDARWGQTGKVNCMYAGRLKDYLEDDQYLYGETISSVDVKKIADAFWKVAQMDPGFTDNASQVLGHKAVGVEDASPMLLPKSASDCMARAAATKS